MTDVEEKNTESKSKKSKKEVVNKPIAIKSKTSEDGSDDKRDPGQPPECLVCGDEASGMHYRAMTCEGCKTFFRRNAARRALLKCDLDLGECTINTYLRRHCAFCRMKKCLAVGMEVTRVWDKERVKTRKRIVKKPKIETEDTPETSKAPPIFIKVEIPPDMEELIQKVEAAYDKSHGLDIESSNRKDLPKPLKEFVVPPTDPSTSTQEPTSTASIKKEDDQVNSSCSHCDIEKDRAVNIKFEPDTKQSCQEDVNEKEQPEISQSSQEGVHEKEQPVMPQINQEGVHEKEQPVMTQINQEGVHEKEQPVMKQINQEGVYEKEQPVMPQINQEGVYEKEQPVMPQINQEGVHEKEQPVMTQVNQEGVYEKEQPVVTQISQEGVYEKEQPMTTPNQLPDDKYNELPLTPESYKSGKVSPPLSSGMTSPGGASSSSSIESMFFSQMPNISTPTYLQGGIENSKAAQKGMELMKTLMPGNSTSNIMLTSYIMKMSLIALRGMIAFCKELPVFSELSWESQAALIKGAFVEFIFIGSIYRFDPKLQRVESFFMPGTAYTRDICEKAGLGNVFDKLSTMADRIFPLQAGKREFSLMFAIAILAPDRPGLDDESKDAVGEIQEKLAHALRLCFESKGPQGRMNFPKAMMVLTDLRNTTETYRNDVMQVELHSNVITPLLAELFDVT